MAKVVKQFRYYSEDNPKNSDGASIDTLRSGDLFKNYTILQLGIQTLPGTKFYLNEGIDPIMVGYTGIYELDLENQTQIHALQFNLESLTTIHNSEGAYLIIDILYEKEANE